MRRSLPLLALTVAVAALALRSAELQPWTLDDAYISFRYAENWAAGHGPVYNVGERVEGYTCFLWVALLALGNALGAPTELLAKVLGGLFATAALGLLAFAHRLVPELDERAGPLAAVALGCSGVASGWALSGMEVPLVVVLVLAGWLAHLAARPGLGGALGALAAMTRPDALLVPVVQGAELAWRRRWRDLGVHGGVCLGLFGPYWAARWAWYGWPLPNTFYAKVGSTPDQLVRGVEYVAGAIGPLAPLWLPALLLPLAPRSSRFAGVVSWGALHVAYVIAVGGDVMPAYRFLAVLLGPVALLGGVGLTAAAARVPLAPWGAVPLALASLVVAHVDPAQSTRILRGNVGRNGQEVGLWLRDQLPADTWVATNTAGSVPYFSGLPTIDMLGLCDEHIAHVEVADMGQRSAGHEKGDGAYVLSRQPDIVLFGAARGRQRPVFRSDRELFASQAFKQQYRLEQYRLGSGASLWLWRRADAPRPRQAPRG